MILPPRFVLVHQAPDDRHVEMDGGEGIGGEEVVAEHGAKLAAEPFADGDGEAHFFAFEDPGGEGVGEGLAEHAFGAAFEELGRGERGGELDEFVVHEG